MSHAKELRDKEIERLLRDHVEEGLESVFREWLLVVAKFLRAKYSKLRDDDLDDVLANALFNLWKTAPTRDSTADLSSWITAVAKRKAEQCLRERSRRQPLTYETLESRDPKQESPTQLLEKQEMVELLFRAVKELPVIEQKVIAGQYYENKTDRELAKELGITPKKCRARRRHALERLRGRLVEWGYLHPPLDPRPQPSRKSEQERTLREAEVKSDAPVSSSTTELLISFDPIDYGWSQDDYVVSKLVDEFSRTTNADY